MEGVNHIKQIMVLIAGLNQMTDDTCMTSGNEAYFAGRGFYHNVKRAADDGVQGAKRFTTIWKLIFPTAGQNQRPIIEWF